MIHVDESEPVGEVEPSFPYRDVRIKRGANIKDEYDLLCELGRGKFGTVYRCRERSTGLLLAAKVVSTPRRDSRRDVEREVDVMRRLRHPRLLQLYDAFDDGAVMCLVLELIEGGELFEKVIDDDFVLTERACTVFMRQICEGVDFIHSQRILHLDMKPENILCLTKTGNRIKIIDFGLARLFDPQKKLQVLFGTPEFVAPEVVNFERIGYGTDMWSVGVICYVLLSGLSPFMGHTDVQTMANVTIAKYDFDDDVFNDISDDAKDFIERLLVKDMGRRLSAAHCLLHPWLRRGLEPPGLLEASKDNLRAFVERWSEHPNSPYVFDPSTHLISPRPASLRGLSPSPCGSLASLASLSDVDDDVDVEDTVEDSVLSAYSRRASDSSCVVASHGRGWRGGGGMYRWGGSAGRGGMRGTTDAASRVNLAEEIRKLSDKLSEMASLTIPLPLPHPIPRVQVESHEEAASPGPPAPFLPPKRPKFRVSQNSRDAPIGSAPPTEVSQYVGVPCDPNPDRTKDLLLQLLDRWDDRQRMGAAGSAGRNSLSIGSSQDERLAQHTISSLASYFERSRAPPRPPPQPHFEV